MKTCLLMSIRHPGLALEFSASEVTRTNPKATDSRTPRLDLLSLRALPAMKRKQTFYFPTAPSPPSPPPPAAPSPSPSPGFPRCLLPDPTLGPWPGSPPAHASRPGRLPSLTRGAPPYWGTRKTCCLYRPPPVPCAPCPASPPTPPVRHVRLSSLSTLHSSFAPHPSSGPSLTSSHLGRRLTRPYSPPAQSPPPPISPLLGRRVNCPWGLESLPVTTRTSQSFGSRAPAGPREQNMVGSSCRELWGALRRSRKPPSPQ